MDAEEAEAEVTAGMSLDMVGVSLRPITFFTGKGGLMAAVWSAPSSLVSALQVTIGVVSLFIKGHCPMTMLQLHRNHLRGGFVVEFEPLAVA